jgi:uncharacterized membrane protein
MNNDGFQKQLENLAGQVEGLIKRVSQLESKDKPLQSSKEPVKPSSQVKIQAPPVSGKSEETLEKGFGIKWMVVVGVIAVVLAIVYEVRIAIQKGWITEEIRCAAAAAFGILLVAIGYATREKFRRYGEVLMSGGIISIFVGLYSAHYMYNLIGSKVSLSMMAVIAAGSALIGWKTSSKAPLFIGALGCYIAPLLIKAFGLSPINFFAYLTIINLAYLIMSIGMRLLILNIGCLYVASFVYWYVWWMIFKQDYSQWNIAFIYQIVQAITFGLATLLPSLMRKEKLSEFGTWTIFPAILLLYFFAGQLLIRNAEQFHLAFALSMTAFVIILSQVGRISLKVNLKDHTPSLMATTVLILVSTHLVYHNFEKIALCWGVFVLFYFAAFAWNYFKRPGVLAAIAIGLLYSMLMLMNFDFGYAKPREIMPFLNWQFPMFAIFSASLLIFAAKAKGNFADSFGQTMIFLGHAMALRSLQIEASRMLFAGTYYSFLITAFWVAYAAIFLTAGMIRNSQKIRTQAITIFGLCTLKVFLYDTSSSSMPVKAASYFTLGIVLIIAGYFYQKYRKKK